MTTDSAASRRARRAALIRWSRTTPAEASAAGRRGQAGLDRRLLEEIDPERSLKPHERAVRLERARRAHFIGLSDAAAKARKAKAAR